MKGSANKEEDVYLFLIKEDLICDIIRTASFRIVGRDWKVNNTSFHATIRASVKYLTFRLMVARKQPRTTLKKLS